MKGSCSSYKWRVLCSNASDVVVGYVERPDDVSIDVVQNVELPRLARFHEGPPPPLRLLPSAAPRHAPHAAACRPKNDEQIFRGHNLKGWSAARLGNSQTEETACLSWDDKGRPVTLDGSLA